jgi:endonuclease/exonuclease/phosphatase family metal-dependent hydrolase
VTVTEADELRERVAALERLVLALADKLAVVAEHLGRLAERKDVRGEDADRG